MAISSYELITVQGENVTADLIVWRRYRARAPGIVEKLLDANPHLAAVHRESPFIPPGVQLRIPIDLDLLKLRPKPQQISLWSANPRL